MIPELGLFALILAMHIAGLLALSPWLIRYCRIPNPALWMQGLSYLQLLCLFSACICLLASFQTHDFSVSYVANHSNTHLPRLYLVSAIWAGHEGSMLLWVLCLAIWNALSATFSQSLTTKIRLSMLSFLGLLSMGLLCFLIASSNPFLRQFPMPIEGRDLNPLLQDPGLAFHPPILYLGYVGFAIPFAFYLANLLHSQVNTIDYAWIRPWTLLAWMFLTLGITLGSYWAYYELGWGGWWFWDPVENASFIPWLSATALLHAARVSAIRQQQPIWTILLAIFTFASSLLGTFLVRSGILTSVHAFVSDPTRGVFLLILFVLTVGGALVIFARRAAHFYTDHLLNRCSREFVMLLATGLLFVAAISILFGTLYPLVIDVLGLGKISVGAPYFNQIILPIMVLIAVLLVFGIQLNWQHDILTRLLWPLLGICTVGAFGLGLLFFMYPESSWQAYVGEFLGLWILAGSLIAIRKQGLSLQQLAMHTAHLGLAVLIIGISLTSAYSIEKVVILGPGEQINVGTYAVHFDRLFSQDTDNFHAIRAELTLTSANEPSRLLVPEKRYYRQHKMPMTEAAIATNLFSDFFVAMGDTADDQQRWTFRIQLKPFIRWIWGGGILIALGGFLAAFTQQRLQRTGINR